MAQPTVQRSVWIAVWLAERMVTQLKATDSTVDIAIDSIAKSCLYGW